MSRITFCEHDRASQQNAGLECQIKTAPGSSTRLTVWKICYAVAW